LTANSPRVILAPFPASCGGILPRKVRHPNQLDTLPTGTPDPAATEVF